MAYPPPKVKRPIRKNVAKSLKSDVGILFKHSGTDKCLPLKFLFIGGQADPAPTIHIIVKCIKSEVQGLRSPINSSLLFVNDDLEGKRNADITF